MRVAKVLFKNEEAATLIQHDDGTFTFRYQDAWMNDSKKPSICLGLPKTQSEYHAPYLFPFFFSMLPEGKNKEVLCKMMKVDNDDFFGILLTSAKHDTIGAVRVIKVES